MLAALLAALLAPAVALACTCSWTGPFTRVALGADLVVLAEVRAYHRHGMDVTVLDVLQGRDPRPVIRVWGDTGALCRPAVTQFPVGTRWILAVSPSRTRGEGDYAVSFCGEYWLRVRDDQAVGRIATPRYGPVTEVAPLADVLAWVRSGGTIPLKPVGVR